MSNTRIEDAGSRIWGGRCAQAFAQSSVLSPESSKGFTLIELIVVITIIVLLAGTFLKRVPYYQAQTEKAAMRQVAAAIQSALVMRYAALMARGAANEKELAALATDNPINWLQQKPRNYAGEFYDPTPKAVAPGNWLFDLKSRDLIYVVDHAEDFTADKGGNKWIRYHVKLAYDQTVGRPESGKELTATLFEPTQPYHWLD